MVLGLITLAHCRLASARARSRPSLAACRAKGKRTDWSLQTWGVTSLAALGQEDCKFDSKTQAFTQSYTRQARFEPAKWRDIPASAHADMQPPLPGLLLHQMVLLIFCTLCCHNNEFSEARIELPLRRHL